MKESGTTRNDTLVTLFRDDSFACFHLFFTSPLFRAQPVLFLLSPTIPPPPFRYHLNLPLSCQLFHRLPAQTRPSFQVSTTTMAGWSCPRPRVPCMKLHGSWPLTHPKHCQLFRVGKKKTLFFML